MVFTRFEMLLRFLAPRMGNQYKLTIAYTLEAFSKVLSGDIFKCSYQKYVSFVSNFTPSEVTTISRTCILSTQVQM